MFKCIICGMIINEKNYALNSNAFLNKHKDKENLFYCPFCGVGKEFIKEEQEKDLAFYEELNPSTIKILDHAMKLEVFNGDFYNKASRLSKDIKNKKIFEDLSRIEFMHANIHRRLIGNAELPKLTDISYEKYDNDIKLLELAKKREEHAVAYYEKYFVQIKNPRIKKIFNALKAVEKEHIIIIIN